MQLLETAASIILAFGLVLIFCKPRKIDVPYISLQVAVHISAGVLFYYMTEGEVTDSANYSEWAKAGWFNSGSGTGFIVNIVALLSRMGIEEYYTQVSVFSIFSACGIAAAYIATSKKLHVEGVGGSSRQILMLGFLLPGLHFWTSPIGKDAVVAVAHGVILVGLFSRSNARYVAIFMAVALLFFVRPHVGFCALVIAGLYFYNEVAGRLGVGARGMVRLLGVAVAILGFYVFYFYLLSYVQKYSLDGFSDFSDFVSARSDVYAGTGSGFDAAAYPYPIRYFLFLLGGVPWKVKSLMQVLALAEGLLVVVAYFLCAKYVFQMRGVLAVRSGKQSGRLALYLFLYVAVLVGVLTLGATNFGLIARQRVMVYMPLLVCFVFLRGAALSRREVRAMTR